MSDFITTAVAGGPVLIAHVVWFAAWIAINLGMVPGVAPFDRFPFPFLTMVVSLEAIFLALFVLASQNRLSRQTDKREHLDLQIDPLARALRAPGVDLAVPAARRAALRPDRGAAGAALQGHWL